VSAVTGINSLKSWQCPPAYRLLLTKISALKVLLRLLVCPAVVYRYSNLGVKSLKMNLDVVHIFLAKRTFSAESIYEGATRSKVAPLVNTSCLLTVQSITESRVSDTFNAESIHKRATPTLEVVPTPLIPWTRLSGQSLLSRLS
jgi:hypothetical protein